MERMTAKITKAFFDSKGFHVDQVGDEGEVLLAGFAMNNREGIRVIIQFDDNEESAKILAPEVAKIPENAMDKMYKVINDINEHYRWIKFVIDEENNTVMAGDDAVIQLDSCGEEIFRCCFQLVHIVDQAYPEIMKAIFS